MNLEKKMELYRRQAHVTVDEEKVLDTIYKAKEVFYQKENERTLNNWEFLWVQFKTLQKRWWLFQLLVLAAAGMLLSYMQEPYYIRRSIGIASIIFVVLLIPELWKNRTYHCVEIETASYFSLRQIYAARFFLFGIVDLFLLTVFCIILQGSLHFTIQDIVIQFLFPMAVTACICFGLLCYRSSLSELASIAFCLMWSAVWWLITINEILYTTIVWPMWLCLFGTAVLVLSIVIYKNIKDVNISLIEHY